MPIVIDDFYDRISKTLFFINTVELGGVETFFLRLAKHTFDNSGNKLNVLAMSRRANNLELLESYKKFCNLYYLDELCHFGVIAKKLPARIVSLLPQSKHLVCERISKFETFHVIDEISLVTAYRLNLFFSKRRPISVGVYHSKLFTWGERTDGRYFYTLPKEIFSEVIPRGNIIFFNNASKRVSEEYFNQSFSDSPVIPIGVIDSGFSESKSGFYKKGKIVSIGRLVEFKTYNENIIRAMADLRHVVELEYFIYGSGPNQKYLEDLVLELELTGKVHFMGNINHSNFKAVLKDCWLFTGSGTALIEAAALGIPCLVGVESSSSTSGFFNSKCGPDYNEYCSDTCTEQYSDCIKLLYSNSHNFWVGLGLEALDGARLFDVKNFIGKFSCCFQSEVNSSFRFNYTNYLFSCFFYLFKKFSSGNTRDRLV